MIQETISNRNDFVNSFCELLTNWVTSEKDVSFFSPNKKKLKNSCGDIIHTKTSVNWLNKIHFTVKYGYKTASFDKHFLPSDNDHMLTMWKNAVKNAGEDKLPILIYKKPYVTSYVFITYELYEQIKKEVIFCNMMRIRYFEAPDTYVFELNEFFNTVKYKQLKKALNQL